jgi:circadian clock protein KaiC
LPIGRSTLISGTSGTGKTVFSLHFLHNGIQVISTSLESSSPLKSRRSISCGMPPALAGIFRRWWSRTSCSFLDASPDPDGQDVAGSFDLSGLIERINYAIRKYKAKRVAIDSITAVFQQYDAVFGGAS